MHLEHLALHQCCDKGKQYDIYIRTCKFVHANGYLAFKLTGETGIDPTNASFTSLFDIKKAKWSAKIIEKVGIGYNKLPNLLWPYEKVGELSGKAAKELGLEKGLPVVIGAADTASAALGLGIVKPGEII